MVMAMMIQKVVITRKIIMKSQSKQTSLGHCSSKVITAAAIVPMLDVKLTR